MSWFRKLSNTNFATFEQLRKMQEIASKLISQGVDEKEAMSQATTMVMNDTGISPEEKLRGRSMDTEEILNDSGFLDNILRDL